MPEINYKRRHTRKPDNAARLNFADPLTQGLVIALYPRHVSPHNLADRSNYVLAEPAYTGGVTEKGWGITKTGTDAQGWEYTNPSTGSANRTIMLGLIKSGSHSGHAILAAGTSASGTRYTFRYISDALRIEIGGGGVTSSLSPVNGEYSCIGLRLDGTTVGDHTFFLNGVTDSGASATTVNTGADEYSIFGDPFAQFSGVDDDLIFWLHWDRALSDAEMMAVYNNPYRIIAGRHLYQPVPAAVGGTAGRSNPLYGPLGGPLAGAIGL